MNIYEKVILLLLLFIGNCYGFKFIFAAMTYNNDVTFFLGLVGSVLLLLTDFLIFLRVIRKYLPKGEEK